MKCDGAGSSDFSELMLGGFCFRQTLLVGINLGGAALQRCIDVPQGPKPSTPQHLGAGLKACSNLEASGKVEVLPIA
jgi:hypothetical protein